MIRNGVKQRWAEGRPVLNGWLSIANSFSAEIMAAQGYDSVTIDMQHGIVGYDGAVPMLQAMRASGVTPLVRVPWLDPADIMKALDAGAYGVICPMINTRAEAERLVSYVRYPPAGVRSFGPSRALFSAGPGYADAPADPAFADISPRDQDRLLDQATTRRREGESLSRGALEAGVRDATRDLTTIGRHDGPLPGISDFTKAYGPQAGARRHADF